MEIDRKLYILRPDFKGFFTYFDVLNVFQEYCTRATRYSMYTNYTKRYCVKTRGFLIICKNDWTVLNETQSELVNTLFCEFIWLVIIWLSTKYFKYADGFTVMTIELLKLYEPPLKPNSESGVKNIFASSFSLSWLWCWFFAINFNGCWLKNLTSTKFFSRTKFY